MTLDKIWEYVNSNKEELSKLGIKFNKHEVNCGDEYRREDGVSYFFKIFGDRYEVGYVYITEDDDDWAQAECHQVSWTRCDDKNTNPDEVFQLIKNYKSENRDHKLKELGI